MKKVAMAAAVLAGFWSVWALCALGAENAPQGLKGSATGFELKMRILEGSRETPPAPAKPVTASYLKFLNFVNVDFEQDLQAEQQIRKIYNLKDVSLLTEASLVWEKGKSEKALHMFRLNGQEYLVMVTPGRLVEKDQFRIEVYEQSENKKTSLLDTEFALPAGNAAVFGFEDTALKPYFISLRVTGWSGVLGGAWSGGVPLYPGEGPRPGEKVKPPRLIREVKPVYPEEAAKAGVEGAVIVEATTDVSGRVAAVKVLRGVPELNQAAIDAVKQWVYEPMVVDGKPHAVTLTVTMQFKLDDNKKPQVSGTAGGVEGGVIGGVIKGQEEAKVKPPKLIRSVNPVYPEIAQNARVEGAIVMEATTDTYGRVADVKVLKGIPLLNQAAIDALRQWVYEPMVIEGKPHPVTFTVTMQFKLDDKKRPQVSGVEGGVSGGVVGGVLGGVEGGVRGGVEGGVEGGVVGGVVGSKDLKEFEADALRAGGGTKSPKLLKMVQPVYPKLARQGRVEGKVVVEAKADEQGNVIDARILRSIPVLDQAAIDAVKQWKYEPLVVDGRPRKFIFTTTVRFVLDEADKRAFDKFAEGAVRAEGDIKPPRLVKEVMPVYPEIARLAEVQGGVILGVKTDETGKVKDVIVVRSIPLLDQAAIDAVRQWVYEPLVVDGKAVLAVFTATVRFELRDGRVKKDARAS